MSQNSGGESMKANLNSQKLGLVRSRNAKRGLLLLSTTMAGMLFTMALPQQQALAACAAVTPGYT